MSELMASLQDPEASAQRLSNLVLRDYALTVKVIRTAIPAGVTDVGVRYTGHRELIIDETAFE